MKLPHPALACLPLALLLLAACSQRHESSEAQRWWAHIQYLAADSLEGRNTGSAAYLKAAHYVADQFKAQGAEPGGTEAYFQSVEFVTRMLRADSSSVSLVRGGHEEKLKLGEDFNLRLRGDVPRDVEAPMVFVGNGLLVPELGYDDLKGLDLHGKIAVYISGGPKVIPGPLRAHASTTAERWGHLREAGAIGQIAIGNPKFTDVPWSRMKTQRPRPSMNLADPSLDETQGLRLTLEFNSEHAQKLFEGSGHSLAEVMALSDRSERIPGFPLTGAIRAHVVYTRGAAQSPNVVGIVRGSDLRLRDEYVVLSAHLDHLGVGTPVNGDSIFNGAMDNASGVASLIEVARMIKESGHPPRRSLILLAVTGEEKGLQGSRYYATHPTVPLKQVVADLNMDMYLPLFPMKHLCVYGADESDLGDRFRAAALKLGADILPDPEPNRNIFVRSDQYNFVREGIPSLMVDFAAVPGSPEDSTLHRWTRVRYHSPTDDLEQPVDKEAAAQFNALLVQFCQEVSRMDARPQWKKDSFFRRFAK